MTEENLSRQGKSFFSKNNLDGNKSFYTLRRKCGIGNGRFYPSPLYIDVLQEDRDLTMI